ncbi:MFS transporter [Nocardia terpenica]|nr:MFS transporter [Nocardia terpenica]MBF6105847.1 MFS transporter [Nocardia terpenica]MBF6113569.1 MFS transporter [Nocardia terpenica]MBF6119588.1 MFS transporter [Nocardia terpenica]MBF6151999.1 MFS transporter [Nocardia terpenica]
MAMPFIGQEFGVGKTMQGLLFTTFSVVYLLCQIPAGYVADRFGGRGIVWATLALWSLFTALTGLASSFAVLLAMRMLFGASQGFFPPASFKVIAERTITRNRATVTSVVMSASGIGTGVAPLVVAPLIADLGWRNAFCWLAIGGIAIGLLLWALLPGPLPPTWSRSVDTAGRTTTGSRREVLASPQIWKFAAIFFAMNMLFAGLVSWVPSYLLETRHLSIRQTGALAAIPMLVTVGATILGGWLYDRYFHRRPRWLLVPVIGAAAILLVLMVSATGAMEFTVYETLALGVASLGSMCVFGLPMRALPPAHTGVGMSVLNFGGQAASASAPLLMGWLVGHFSYTVAFGVLVVTTTIAALLAFWLPQRPDQFGFSTTENRETVPTTAH